MGKRIALVKLIENSFIISDKIKKTLLWKIEMMNDEEVETLGRVLLTEREILLENEDKIAKFTKKIIDYYSKKPPTNF